MTAAALDPVAAVAAIGPIDRQTQASAPTRAASGFSQMLVDGIDGVDRKVADATAIARQFAVDDSVPVHQVTYALEQAHLSLELMMQVRARVLDGYQQIMGMQL